MKFQTLTIENFLTIGQAKVSLADRGLVLIQGVNQDDSSADSNGAGKSSLADALSWCLFGSTAREATGDDVVNTTAGKNCCVSVEIEDGGERYRITRYRKHAQGKNSLQLAKDNGSGWDDLTAGNDKLTQNLVNGIIGCSYEVFTSAVYAGQERMPDLPAMTDKMLKVLVEEAAGVTLLEAAYSEARKRLQTAKSAYDALTAQIDNRTVKIDSAKALAVQLMGDSKDWEEVQAQKIAQKAAVYRKAVATVKTLQQEAEKHDPDYPRANIKVIDERLAEVEQEKVELDKRDRAATQAKIDANNAARDFKSAKEAYERLKEALDKIDSRVGEPCDECGKPYCEHDLKDAREIAERKVRDALVLAKQLRSAAEDAQKRAQSLADARDAHKATLTDVSSELAQRATYADLLNAMLDHDRKLEQAKKDARQIKQEIEDLDGEPNPFSNRLSAQQHAIQSLEAEIDDLIAKRDEAALEVEIADSVTQVFSPAGVRAYILDDVTPFLNAQTAKYLGSLSDGNITATWTTLVKTAKGELREKFSIEVENAKGGKKFKLISGGEKRKVRVAAALALQDLVARRATKPIDLFIADEVDNALDPAGLERLMGILDEKAKERGTVVVISHADLKDWISQQIIVTKENEVSTISEVIA